MTIRAAIDLAQNYRVRGHFFMRPALWYGRSVKRLTVPLPYDTKGHLMAELAKRTAKAVLLVVVTPVIVGTSLLGFGVKLVIIFISPQAGIPLSLRPPAKPVLGVLHADPVRYCMSFLAASDIATACCVSKRWQTSIDVQHVWKEASKRDGVPFVEAAPGEIRNHKDDFRFLHPLTFGRKFFGQYFGNVEGEIPRLSREIFQQLKHAPDIYSGGPMFRKWMILVDYPAIKITVGPNRPLRWDADSRELVEVPDEERANVAISDLTVPFTFETLVLLAKYPITRGVNGDGIHSSVRAEVKNQCGDPPNVVTLRLMRRGVPDNTRALSIEDQRALVGEHGYQVSDIRELSIFVAIEILRSGTRPYGLRPDTFVRGNKEFVHNGSRCSPMLGCNSSLCCYGITVVRNTFPDSYNRAVVPSVLCGSSQAIILEDAGLDEEP